MATWDKEDPLPIGTLIDNKYEILEHLGSGGQGFVYRIENIPLKRIEVLKQLRGVITDTTGTSFRKEAQRTANLDHPNIVEIHDFIEWEHLYFYRMSFDASRSLDNVIAEYAEQSMTLPLERVLFIMKQLANAVQYGHDSNIIHRDIKPANILIGTDYTIKLSDFGIAAIAESLTSSSSGSVERQIVGTPAYMAPEQFSGAADQRTDIYQMGVVFYQLVTGATPFQLWDSPTSAQLTEHIMQQQIEFPADISLLLPSKIENIIQKCLEKNPQARYACATDVRKDILKYEEQQHKRKRNVRILKTGAVFSLAVSLLVLATYTYNKVNAYLEWRKTTAYIVEKFRNDSDLTFGEQDKLAEKLELRLYHQHLLELVNSGNIDKSKYPYAVAANGTYFMIDPNLMQMSTMQFWVGQWWRASERTGEKQFYDLAIHYTYQVHKDSSMDSIRTDITRFMAQGLASTFVTDDSLQNVFKESADYAASMILKRFNRAVGYIQTNGSIRPKTQLQDLNISTLLYDVPYLMWISKHSTDDTLRYVSHEAIRSHGEFIIKYSLRENGSVRYTTVFDPTTNRWVGEKNPRSRKPIYTLSRSQAQAIYGLWLYYEFTGRDIYKQAALQAASYFRKTRSPLLVHFYDDDEQNSNLSLSASEMEIVLFSHFDDRSSIPDSLKLEYPGILKGPLDTSSDVIALPTLKRMGDVLGDSTLSIWAYRLRENIIRYFTTTDPAQYQGIVRGTCVDLKRGHYTDSSTPWSDLFALYSFGWTNKKEKN